MAASSSSSSSSYLVDDDSDTSNLYYVDAEDTVAQDVPFLENNEFCPYPDTLPTTCTPLMPYERRINQNKLKNIRKGTKQITETCPHCGRTVKMLYRNRYGCTFECSLGLFTDQPELYNLIHSLIARDFSGAIVPAPKLEEHENPEHFWKHMLSFHYDHSDPRNQHLREQFQKNQVTYDRYVASKRAK